jgi:hypothetical protein
MLDLIKLDYTTVRLGIGNRESLKEIDRKEKF